MRCTCLTVCLIPLSRKPVGVMSICRPNTVTQTNMADRRWSPGCLELCQALTGHGCVSAMADGACGSNLRACHQSGLTYVTGTLDGGTALSALQAHRMESRILNSGPHFSCKSDPPDLAGGTLCVRDRNGKTQPSDRSIFGWPLVIVLIIALHAHMLL